MKYMVVDFANALRNCLCQVKDEDTNDSQLIIGVNGRLFEIDAGNFDVCELVDDVVSIGSGVEFALGSLHSTTGEDHKIRVQKALEAASYYCQSVSAPFTIIYKKAPNEKKRNEIKSLGDKDKANKKGVEDLKGKAKAHDQKDQPTHIRREGRGDSDVTVGGEDEGNSGDGPCDSTVLGQN